MAWDLCEPVPHLTRAFGFVQCSTALASPNDHASLASTRSSSVTVVKDTDVSFVARLCADAERWLCVFGRTLTLLYFLAYVRLAFFTCRLQKSAPISTRRIRIVRGTLKGAPLWLAFGVVAHLLPVCTSAPVVTGVGLQASAHAITTASDFHRGRPSANAVSSATNEPASPAALIDPRYMAEVFRFQTSSCHTEAWIDRGDTVGFLRRTIQDELS